MSKATRLQVLQYNAIEAVNAIVECQGVKLEEIHYAVQRVREHLEARAAQTAPRADSLAVPGMAEALEADAAKLDALIGDQLEFETEMAALLGDFK